MPYSRIFLLLLITIVALSSCKKAEEKTTAEEQASATTVLLSDPVCGMKVSHADADTTVVYNGVEYGFCNRTHYEQFQAAPEKFVKPL